MVIPLQGWILKDDKVVTVGGEYSRPIYTYVEHNIAGENDVPLFVTYIERIFTGTTSDIVQFGARLGAVDRCKCHSIRQYIRKIRGCHGLIQYLVPYELRNASDPVPEFHHRSDRKY